MREAEPAISRRWPCRWKVRTRVGRQALILRGVAAISLAGCQTTGSDNNPPASVVGKYNLFLDQADHVKELLVATDALGASKVYSEEKIFFFWQGQGAPSCPFHQLHPAQKPWYFGCPSHWLGWLHRRTSR